MLRARLRMVARRTSAKNSLDRLLEKWNVPRLEDLPPLYRIQAAAQTALITVLGVMSFSSHKCARPAA